MRKQRKRTIFIFWFLSDWGRFRRINEIFAREFAKDPKYKKVVAIDSDGNLWTLIKNIKLYFSTKDKKLKKNSILHIVKLILPFPIKDGNKTYVKTLFRIFPRPFYKYTICRIIDYFVLIPQFLILRLLAPSRPSLGFIFPPLEHTNLILKIFQFDKVITYLADDIIDRAKESGESGPRIDYLYRLYDIALKNSDIDFTLAKELAKTYEKMKPGIIHSPLAVDFEYFQEAKAYDKDLEKISKPIVGYLGFLGPAMDQPIISHIVKENRNISFVFAGPVKTGDKFFTKLEKDNQNVHLVGPKHFLDVPGFMKSCDVLISPKTPSKCAGGHSRKLYEYMSTGNPIVMTNVPPAEKFKNLIYIANTPKKFNKCIKEALSNDREENRKQRITTAKKNSWQVRTSEMRKLIDQLFPVSK